MPDDLKILTTVGNEAEAEMVAERLSEAGIRHMSRTAGGGIRLGAAAARDVYLADDPRRPHVGRLRPLPERSPIRGAGVREVEPGGTEHGSVVGVTVTLYS